MALAEGGRSERRRVGAARPLARPSADAEPRATAAERRRRRSGAEDAASGRRSRGRDGRRRDEARSRVSAPRQGRDPDPHQQRGDVRPAAPARRGAPLRDQLPPRTAAAGSRSLRALRHPGDRPGPPAPAPAPLRQRQACPRGDRRRAGGRRRHDPHDRRGGLRPLGQAAPRRGAAPPTTPTRPPRSSPSTTPSPAPTAPSSRWRRRAGTGCRGDRQEEVCESRT